MHVYVHGEAKGLLGSVSLLTLHSVDSVADLGLKLMNSARLSDQ